MKNPIRDKVRRLAKQTALVSKTGGCFERGGMYEFAQGVQMDFRRNYGFASDDKFGQVGFRVVRNK